MSGNELSVEEITLVMDRAERDIQEEAIRFLLDGLGVGSISELKALVDAGRELGLLMGVPTS